MMVGNICKTEVVTVTPDETVAAAARLMREKHVGLLVVVAAGEVKPDLMPAGVLTDRDIVTAVVAKDADPHALKVGDVMTRHPLLAGESNYLEGILQLMRDAGVRRTPVVGSRGQLTGILSLDDVIAQFSSQLTDVAGAFSNEQTRERATRG
jgi:CBS domain-containing protein